MNHHSSHPKFEVIYGTRPILEAVRAGKQIDRVLIQHNIKNEQITNLIKELVFQGIVFQRVSVEKFLSVKDKNHQGVMAFVSPIVFADIHRIVSFLFNEGKDGLFLLLDSITDVRNFGAIVRTAEAAGVDAIIIPDKGSAQISEDAMKTSAGALNYIQICRVSDVSDTVLYLKESGFQIVACTEIADKYFYEASFVQPTVIILGAEDTGISGKILSQASEQIKINMLGKIESLNVSVAAGVILYECLRQRITNTISIRKR